jgi:o-succinylbenzoate synthase
MTGRGGMKLSLRRLVGASAGAGNARHAWPKRGAILIELRVGACRGLGEASPLPGFSRDSLAHVESALALLDLAALEEAMHRVELRDALEAAAALLPRDVPAARMALETAVLDLRGRQQHRSAPELLGADDGAERALAWLVGVPGGPALGAAHRAAQSGYRDFKVKLGAEGQLSAEIAGVVELRRALGAAARLRLDANGGWSEAEAGAAARELEPLNVEFLEEPWASWTHPRAGDGRNPDGFSTRIPLALDESLRGVDADDLERLVCRSRARVVILKPMLLGGLTHCLDLGRRAAALNIDVVVSHCFDGPVAMAAAGALALALPGRMAQGLAPHAGLDAWPTVPLPIQHASLRTWTAPGLGLAAEHLG